VEIAASHILVMHRGSMRAPPDVTRSKEEALERAKAALARATAGEDFGVLAAEYSDDRASKVNGGKLGRFTRRMMIGAFADAAFALKPGELSGIVETPFGYHVILRTE
jgi:parvulin-like peptidyl-prolyl isomerase